jgi:hypothetical protein
MASLQTLPAEILHKIDSILTYKQHTALSWTCKGLYLALPKTPAPGLTEWYKLNNDANRARIPRAMRQILGDPDLYFRLFRFRFPKVPRIQHISWAGFVGPAPRWDRCPSCGEEAGNHLDLSNVFRSSSTFLQERVVEYASRMPLRPVTRWRSVPFQLIVEDDKIFFDRYDLRPDLYHRPDANPELAFPYSMVMCEHCRIVLAPGTIRRTRTLTQKEWN